MGYDPVKIRNIEIGCKRPKICVPIVERTKKEILSEAESFSNIPLDLVEWRVDWFEDAFDKERVTEVLKELRNILGDTPILFTFRTLKEGGEADISLNEYRELLIFCGNSGFADLVDVEIFTGDEVVRSIIESVHKAGVKVVGSNHDFDKTPDKEDIIKRLCKMQEMGADITKIAVMPRCKADVLTLLCATEEMQSIYADRPFITMSMGKDGLISRLCGEIFGSALTFGAAKKASAPGQIDVRSLDKVLDIIHSS